MTRNIRSNIKLSDLAEEQNSKTRFVVSSEYIPAGNGCALIFV